MAKLEEGSLALGVEVEKDNCFGLMTLATAQEHKYVDQNNTPIRGVQWVISYMGNKEDFDLPGDPFRISNVGVWDGDESFVTVPDETLRSSNNSNCNWSNVMDIP